MFTIEIVVGSREGSPVERAISGIDLLAAAEASARSLLDKVRRERPELKADGYVIRDGSGEIIHRSWVTRA